MEEQHHEEIRIDLSDKKDIERLRHVQNVFMHQKPFLVNEVKCVIVGIQLGFDGSKYLRVKVKGVEVDMKGDVMDNKIKEAKFQYKCRMCGTVYDGPITGAGRATQVLIDFIVTGDSGPGIPLAWHDVHACDDDNMGVSDLIGYLRKERG